MLTCGQPRNMAVLTLRRESALCVTALTLKSARDLLLRHTTQMHAARRCTALEFHHSAVRF